MAEICGPFTLEQLDLFGTLDSLAFSLDDAVWESANTCILEGAGEINGIGTMSALTGYLKDSDAAFTGYALMTATPYDTELGVVQFAANGTMNASIYKFGEEWGDESPQTNTWTLITAGSNTWTPKTIGTNTWQ